MWEPNRCGASAETGLEDPKTVARHWRRLGVGVVLFALPWLILVLYGLQAALPTNPLALPAQRELVKVARQLMPEGWSFFTRNPQEADILIFKRRIRGGWKPEQIRRYAHLKHAFGWSRRPRAQGLELGFITTSLKGEDWQPCKALADCLHASSPTVITIPNPSPIPTLCGNLAMVSASPVPWAWARTMGQFHHPERVVFLSIQC